MAKAPAFVWTTDRELRIESRWAGGCCSWGSVPTRAPVARSTSTWATGTTACRPSPPTSRRCGGRPATTNTNGRGGSWPPGPSRCGTKRDAWWAWSGVAVDITDLREARAKRSRSSERELARPASTSRLARLNRTRLSELADVHHGAAGGQRTTASLGPGRRSRGRRTWSSCCAWPAGGPICCATCAMRASESPERDARTPVELDGAETILLVDDEPQVRGLRAPGAGGATATGCWRPGGGRGAGARGLLSRAASTCCSPTWCCPG